MRRKKDTSAYQIALLATGDEVKNGDILNTNSQNIAALLFSNGMHVGMHMVTGDTVADIETAIHFLLQSHQALIIIGGLGPTSDDLTRFALSNAIHRELIFDEVSWSHIINRLQSIGLTTPESNRQQALFPESANIIPNLSGTAAGCWLTENQKIIFMLPGPPPECLPMVDTNVVPILKENGFEKRFFHKKWLLFGISEGHIAEELDALAKPYDCIMGYRFCYPYIEVKIYSEHQADFETLVPLVEKNITPYMLEDGKYSASELLKKWLILNKSFLTICDYATGGLLEVTLRTPETNAYLNFTAQEIGTKKDIKVDVIGLDAFWQSKGTTKTNLEFYITHKNKTTPFKKEIPLRGPRVKVYAVEYICRKIYQCLSG